MPILRPLISPNNTINVNPGNNSLIITDYADNLKRIAGLAGATGGENATGTALKAAGHRVSVDSLNRAELKRAIAAGAESISANVSRRVCLSSELGIAMPAIIAKARPEALRAYTLAPILW